MIDLLPAQQFCASSNREHKTADVIMTDCTALDLTGATDAAVHPELLITDLPNDILAKIFALLPFRKRRRIGKVCTRFWSVCVGPSATWNQVELRCRSDLMERPLAGGPPRLVPPVEQLKRHLRWLHPRLSAVRNLDLIELPTDGQAVVVLEQLVRLLTPSLVLQSLSLQRFELPSASYAALALLPACLQDVSLAVTDFSAHVAGPLSDALSRLTSLTRLELQLGESPDVLLNEVPFPAGILSCMQLRRLRIDARAALLFRTAAPAIGCLQHLSSLQLHGCGVRELPSEIRALTALTELQIREPSSACASPGVTLPLSCSALISLRVLSVTMDRASSVLASIPGLVWLEVDGLASCAEAEAICADFWQVSAPHGVSLGGLPDDGCAHGRWRIEWRQRSGGRKHTHFCTPKGSTLRHMQLNVSDEPSAWD